MQAFADLLSANHAYQEQTDKLAKNLVDLKDSVLDNQSEAELYELIEQMLSSSTSAEIEESTL